ncbi:MULTISPECIES: HPP family protein [unclassified Chelatococcus]|uniref:HPP family protein n=1 Tax=unclassified Chelatococcus TaxID=2638111 RepID=UPI001BCF01CA|nr:MULTISPECIES: HPP family protein [unclassified Chelatococcus]MBS7695970.1 HPP family protein [Chelatococcus sp. YT9]MBX3555655.1 HPP family protein [Chelatococcus sp.]
MLDSELAYNPKPSRRFRLFAPILAGASLRERMIACVGALISIVLTGTLCGFILGFGDHLPLLVAPIGASAVLLFAVPASPLAQPWPILGGNVISALVGLLVARAIPDPALAAGVGVASAIAAMSLTRSLHPPGGAAALTAVLGGPAVAKWGLLFPLVPVGLNSCILIGVGLLFHRLARRSYPHRTPLQLSNPHGTADLPASVRVGFREEDVDAALASLDEAFDIDPTDLGRILREIERQTIIRSHGDLTCADIMSRDVIAIRREATREQARALLLRHNIRVLPVMDNDGGLLGTVGLRELSKPGERIAEIVVPARTASPDTPAVALLPVLTDGRTHAVIVTNGRKVVGLISQTDLLSALGRLAFTRGRSQGAAA